MPCEIKKCARMGDLKLSDLSNRRACATVVAELASALRGDEPSGLVAGLHGGPDLSQEERFTAGFAQAYWAVDPWQRPSDTDTRGRPIKDKGDFGGAPQFPGLTEHYLAWRIAVRRWESRTDHAEYRLGDLVIKELPWDLQSTMCREISTRVLNSRESVEAIIKRLDEKAGLESEHEKKLALKECLMQMERRQDENLTDYVRRRDREVDRAAEYGMVLPTEAKGLLLQEGAKLSDQGEQNLVTLTGGRQDYETIW